MLLVTKDSVQGFFVLMVSSSDKATGVTGLTLSIELAKNGGALVPVSPTVNEIGKGVYWIVPIAAHRDTEGVNAWQIEGSGADPVTQYEQVGDYKPTIYLGAVPIA